MRELNTLAWFGVPGSTDLWQPVDAGVGQLVKSQYKFAQARQTATDARAAAAARGTRGTRLTLSATRRASG